MIGAGEFVVALLAAMSGAVGVTWWLLEGREAPRERRRDRYDGGPLP